MIERLIDVLSEQGREFTSEEIAEALWLAIQLPPQETRLHEWVSAVSPGPAKQATGSSGETRGADGRSSLSTGPRLGSAQPGPKPGELFVPNPSGSSTGRMRAVPVRVPAAEALPNKQGINAALRCLKRRYPSPRVKILDVTATVEQIANGGPTVAVLKSAPERWLEVVLIVDESASMRVWRETLDEFAVLLARHGSFRDVRTWYLNLDEVSLKLYSEAGLPGSPRRLRHPKELIDSSGRRLILIASDCVSPGWISGAMYHAILAWGRGGMLALLQVLPERLWGVTALGDSTAQFRAYSAGVANSSLRVQSVPFDYEVDSAERKVRAVSIPLPVVSLEGWSVSPWARMVANVGEATSEGVTMQRPAPAAGPIPQPREGPKTLEAAVLAAGDRVARFRAAASPAARQLVGYLAVAPLSLPVMRLVQRAMMPSVRQVDLAEVLLGGLMHQVTAAETVTRADDVFYEFLPGVREVLQESVSEADQRRVLRAVSRLIENQTGSTIDFGALLAGDDSALGSGALYPIGLRFAEITSDISRRLGWSKRRTSDPPPAGLLSVLVVGTGTFELPAPVQLAALQAGTAVANAGANLITGGWPGVDHMAARAYLEAQSQSSQTPAGELVQVVEGKAEPDLRGGRIVRAANNEGFAASISRADLVILIGGAGGTWLAFEQALAMDKLVLPFKNTGTDARHAAVLLELLGHAVPLSLVKAEFGNEREAREAGSQLRSILTDFDPRESSQAIDNRELLWVTNKILPVAQTYLRKTSGFDLEANEIYREFKEHTLSQEKFQGLVIAFIEDVEPAWRSAGYLAIEAWPSENFVEPHYAQLKTEVGLGLNRKETRPLFRWLMATNSMVRIYPDAFDDDLSRSLEGALRSIAQASGVDPGGQCKNLIRKILQHLGERYSNRRAVD